MDVRLDPPSGADPSGEIGITRRLGRFDVDLFDANGKHILGVSFPDGKTPFVRPQRPDLGKPHRGQGLPSIHRSGAQPEILRFGQLPADLPEGVPGNVLETAAQAFLAEAEATFGPTLSAPQPPISRMPPRERPRIA